MGAWAVTAGKQTHLFTSLTTKATQIPSIVDKHDDKALEMLFSSASNHDMAAVTRDLIPTDQRPVAAEPKYHSNELTVTTAGIQHLL